MGYKPLLVMLLILAAGCDRGPSPAEALDRADTLMATGRSQDALRLLQETRIDNPHDGVLVFAMGMAQQATVAGVDAPGSYEAARDSLTSSATSFLRAAEMAPDPLGWASRFNAATVRIAMDGPLKELSQYEARVENMAEAVSMLAVLVRERPEDADARQNLDHARYRLARLRQNPARDDDSGEEDSDDPPREPPPTKGAVDAVTTEIPRARAEIVDGSTIVLHMPPDGEDGP